MAYSTTDQVYYKSGLTSAEVPTGTVDQFISWADKRIELRTGKKYTTPSAFTEYFDGSESEYNKNWMDEGGIVTGTKPYQESRFNVILSNTPVTEITAAYFLDRSQTISMLLSYDDSGSAYTDNTTEANSVKGMPFYAFAQSVAIGDILYIGCALRFMGVTFDLSTAGVGGVLIWEYYNGSGWISLSVSESVSGADDLNASGKVSWSLPQDWQENTVNNYEFYWIRAKVTTNHSTSPMANQIYLDPDTLISKEISLGKIDFENYGRVLFRDDEPSDGIRNVRIEYKAGESSVPTEVAELSANLAAQSCLIRMIGGSFDDAATWSLPGVSISKGEPYMNLRDALTHLKAEEEVLWKQLGYRVDVFVT